MPILGPDGEPLEDFSQDVAMPSGGSLKLHFERAGGTIRVDDDKAIRMPAGEWILMPLAVWQHTLRLALAASETDTASEETAVVKRRN